MQQQVIISLINKTIIYLFKQRPIKKNNKIKIEIEIIKIDKLRAMLNNKLKIEIIEIDQLKATLKNKLKIEIIEIDKLKATLRNKLIKFEEAEIDPMKINYSNQQHTKPKANHKANKPSLTKKQSSK